jgi:hypothetical protein
LDRLARSTRDLLNTIHAITEKKRGSNHWPIRGPLPLEDKRSSNR